MYSYLTAIYKEGYLYGKQFDVFLLNCNIERRLALWETV